jgi:hypothetical protein
LNNLSSELWEFPLDEGEVVLRSENTAVLSKGLIALAILMLLSAGFMDWLSWMSPKLASPTFFFTGYFLFIYCIWFSFGFLWKTSIAVTNINVRKMSGLFFHPPSHYYLPISEAVATNGIRGELFIKTSNGLRMTTRFLGHKNTGELAMQINQISQARRSSRLGSKA